MSADKEWHKAWLCAHPERSVEWLSDRLMDGFHIHHIDGDKGNNDPLNLVLIDGVDHMRLHGCKNIRSVNHGERKLSPAQIKERAEKKAAREDKKAADKAASLLAKQAKREARKLQQDSAKAGRAKQMSRRSASFEESHSEFMSRMSAHARAIDLRRQSSNSYQAIP